jgi:type IV secretion system protein VirD4
MPEQWGTLARLEFVAPFLGSILLAAVLHIVVSAKIDWDKNRRQSELAEACGWLAVLSLFGGAGWYARDVFLSFQSIYYSLPLPPPSHVLLSVDFRQGFIPQLIGSFSAYQTLWVIMGLGSVLGPLCTVIFWRQLIGDPGALARAHRAGRRIISGLRSRPKVWLPPKQRRVLERDEAGLPLGLYGGNPLRFTPVPDVFPGGHHALFCGTRGGKGVSAILPAILDHQGPVVVIDLKGENFAVCRRHRKALGRRQVVLNPFGLIDGKSQAFNPMSYIRGGDQRDIAVMADGLIMPIGNENNGWISDDANLLMQAAIEAVATLGTDEDKTLLHVRDLLVGPDNLKTFEAWAEAPDLCCGRLARAAASILNRGDRERGIIIGHISTSLSWLNFERMAKLVTTQAKTPVELDLLLDDKIDLYIVIPQDMGKDLRGFMRLMMNLVLGVPVRQDGKRKVKAPILAVMDEFTRLGRLEKMLDVATIAAGAGIQAAFVVQDLATLEDVYGKAGASTLLGSCATTRIWGLGSGDRTTAEWVKSTMGTYLREKVSRSRGSDGKINTSKTVEDKPALDVDEMLTLPPSAMLCRFRSQQPILLERIISHEHPAYRDKLDHNPTRAA